jgi:hypothetical protein
VTAVNFIDVTLAFGGLVLAGIDVASRDNEFVGALVRLARQFRPLPDKHFAGTIEHRKALNRAIETTPQPPMFIERSV